MQEDIRKEVQEEQDDSYYTMASSRLYQVKQAVVNKVYGPEATATAHGPRLDDDIHLIMTLQAAAEKMPVVII